MKLLLRANAGPTIGTEHVMRMFALGQAWKKQGGSVAFACGTLPNALIARIQSENFDVFKLENSNADSADAEETLELVKQLKPGWVGLDGSDFKVSYQSALSKYSAKLLVLSNEQADYPNANLIVNQNIAVMQIGDEGFNQSVALSGPVVLNGPRYILPSAFPIDETAPKPTVKEARRILVASDVASDSDSDEWTIRTLNAISELNRKNLIVSCYVGPGRPLSREIELLKKNPNLNLRILRSFDHVSALMNRVDLAVAADSTSGFKIAQRGVPTLVVTFDENDNAKVQTFSELGTLDFVEQAPLNKTLKRIIRDFELRKSMSEIGVGLVDGKGAMRICQEMTKMQFSFRSAQADDAKLLWQWRNDPEVRSVSFSQETIELETHQNWLGKRINDPNTRIVICETQDGTKVGSIRFDIADNGTEATMSIIVDQAMRGRGLGKAIIKQTCFELFQTTSVNAILAQIKSGNTASAKAFRAAGFEPIEPAIIKEQIALQYQLLRSKADDVTRESLKISA